MNRIVVALVLGYFAAFGLPKGVPKVTVSVRQPTAELVSAVKPVSDALSKASSADKNLFADVWIKAGRGVRGESETQLIPDTRALREYSRIAAIVGWKRIGGLSGKYAGLDAACNKAFESVMGLDVKPFDPAAQGQFSDLCDALAWAAIHR